MMTMMMFMVIKHLQGALEELLFSTVAGQVKVLLLISYSISGENGQTICDILSAFCIYSSPPDIVIIFVIVIISNVIFVVVSVYGIPWKNKDWGVYFISLLQG